MATSCTFLPDDGPLQSPLGDRSDRRRVAFRKPPLVPVGIERRTALAASSRATWSAVRFQPTAPEILSQLLFVARADDDRRHRRALQQPVECHLGTVLPVSFATASSASTTW